MTSFAPHSAAWDARCETLAVVATAWQSAQLVTLVAAWTWAKCRHREGYNARVGLTDPPSVGRHLLSLLAPAGGALVAPLHTRRHWTTLVVQARDGVVRTTVYDSAPSEPVRRDARTLLRAIGLPQPHFVCLARQPAGSNECGLHCVLFAFLLASLPPAARSAAAWAPTHTPTSEEESLSLSHPGATPWHDTSHTRRTPRRSTNLSIAPSAAFEP